MVRGNIYNSLEIGCNDTYVHINIRCGPLGTIDTKKYRRHQGNLGNDAHSLGLIF